MSDAKDDRFRDIEGKLRKLRPRQLWRVIRLTDALIDGTEVFVNHRSDFASNDFAEEFGDQLRLHHNGSGQALTKDKFEYALVDALRDSGHQAAKLPNGNPGEDITVDGIAWSLKTQADRQIKEGLIHVSKFMELGKGAWNTVADIEALRDRMFKHMEAYERIFTLRCLAKSPVGKIEIYEYELVEIPKEILKLSADVPIQIKEDSRQFPQPASCYVYDGQGLAFELYFDGGTERKLQVRKLDKNVCFVHATWTVKVFA